MVRSSSQTDEVPVTPPTSLLPPIARIGHSSLTNLHTSVDYLRLLYNPEVRGTRRRKTSCCNLPTSDRGLGNASNLDEIRSNEFERAYAIRWLTALISRGDTLSNTNSEDERSRNALIDHAAALLAACAGTAASGRLTRTFLFDTAPQAGQGDPVTVQLADAPLENGDYGTLGAQTWGAACVLAEMLAEMPAQFGLPLPSPQGSSETGGRDTGESLPPFRVIELGAGTGLAGLAAAKFLAVQHVSAHVCLTDVHPAVLRNLRTNVVVNFPQDPDSHFHATVDVSVTKLDWGVFANSNPENDDDDRGELDRFDLILGADIVYEALHAEWLRACVERLLAPGPRARFHLLMPLRRTHVAESKTVQRVFGSHGTNSDDPKSARDGTDGRLVLTILCEEHFVCDADGGGADEVEYAYYQIGWAEST